MRTAGDGERSELARAEAEGEHAGEVTFYRRLIDLARRDELDALLADALALIIESTGARLGYVELFHEHTARPRYWCAHGCNDEDVDAIRALLSSGIIQAAIAEGDTVETPSAREDRRFADRASVRGNEIRAVLCAPIGRPALGVVYLQDRTVDAPFTIRHRTWAEAFASQLALVAERIDSRRTRAEQHDHTAEIRRRFRCAGILGRSEALARALADAADMAPLTIGVLITGPSGTGKSHLARAIHDGSPRADKPFVDINCGAIAPTLIESELFGVERGAFTGAVKSPGKIAAARGGTLFLDEIGDLPADAQVKLLQLLQEKRYYPVGSAQAVKADVRIIAATNADLRERVEQGRFRLDLYYRLEGMRIEMPSLAARRDDIPMLVEHFCAEACRQHSLAEIKMSRRAVAACVDARWPGEVRELAKRIEVGVARAAAAGSSTVLDHHVFGGPAVAADSTLTYREATRRAQRRIILDALEDAGGDVPRAAERLDMGRSSLYQLIIDLDIKRPR